MIRIGKTYTQQTENSVRLSADVAISGKKDINLWFLLPQQRANSRGDSFVMALLPMAMREGHDIVCETPVSDRLQYQLNQCLIPAVMKKMGKNQDEIIHLRAPLAQIEDYRTPRSPRGAAALKFSQSAEFIFALESHGNDSLYPLTHLAVWNLEGTRGREAFQAQCRAAAELARQRGLALIGVDSNLGDALEEERMEEVGCYWELASALALEDLKLYLFCSNRPIAEFRIDPQKGAAYTELLAICSCTESLRVCPVSPDIHTTKSSVKRLAPLVIGKPYVEQAGERQRLCAQVELNGESQVMWISVLSEYGDYLADDRCDAFVAALLPKALREGRDLVCRAPVSRLLLYQINQYLIPILSANIDIFHRITLRAEAVSPLPTAGNVCTGGTGGVDSMYSLLESMNIPEGSRCKLTHLFLTSNGAIERGVPSDTLELMADRARRRIIPGTELDVLTIDSNIHELLPEEVFLHVVDFRHAAVLLALQKYFGTAMISATHSFDELMFTAGKSARYEFMVLNFLSTGNMIFYSAGGAFSRREKTNAISDFSIARRALHPCIDETAETNCGVCLKCTWTAGELYATDKLENFSEVFDAKAFTRRRYFLLSQPIRMIWAYPSTANHDIEVIEQMKESGKTLWPAYVLAAVRFFLGRLFYIPWRMAQWCKKTAAGKL